MKDENEKIYLTPAVIRIWHWVNALGIVTLCLTGFQIRFPVQAPIFGAYKNAVMLHDTAGIVVSVLYVVWLVYYGLVARTLGRLYIPTLDDIKQGFLRQGRYYLVDFFKGRPNPHVCSPDSKFNPLQKSAYMMFMLVLLPLVIVSGIMLMNIMPLRRWILAAGGLPLLVAAHFLIACAFIAFLCVHVYLATMGHSVLAHFKAMWTGWEEVHHGLPEPEVKAGTAYISNTSEQRVS